MRNSKDIVPMPVIYKRNVLNDDQLSDVKHMYGIVPLTNFQKSLGPILLTLDVNCIASTGCCKCAIKHSRWAQTWEARLWDLGKEIKECSCIFRPPVVPAVPLKQFYTIIIPPYPAELTGIGLCCYFLVVVYDCNFSLPDLSTINYPLPNFAFHK